jgi:hypothetical protein
MAPDPDRHRALELLAASRDGMTEALLVAHGFRVAQMVELVREGLATATGEHFMAGRRRVDVTLLRITEAGRRVLADRPKR